MKRNWDTTRESSRRTVEVFDRPPFSIQPMPVFYVPSAYESPLTAEGRARTIAALLLAQGDPGEPGQLPMRRDVLNSLMSSSAVNYWLNQKGWLEVVGKVGRVQILRLTEDGVRTCFNSVAGGSDTPTTRELVAAKRRTMLEGGRGHTQKEFAGSPE